MLSQGIGTPLDHHALSVQAKHDVADKSAGQTHPYMIEEDIDANDPKYRQKMRDYDE